jgi:hypothetical protein
LAIGGGLVLNGTVLSATGAAAGHHATHEPGGADAIINAAWTNQPNIFTARQQRITAQSPCLVLTDTLQPADATTFRIINANGSFYISVNNDDLTVDQAVPLRLMRSGDATIGRDLTVGRNINATGIITASGDGLRFTAAASWHMWMTNANDAVDAKKWRWTIYQGSQELRLEAYNDAETVSLLNPIVIRRDGDVFAARDLYAQRDLYVTGNIQISGNYFSSGQLETIVRASYNGTNAGNIALWGGSSWNTGGMLHCYGNAHSAYPGWVLATVSGYFRVHNAAGNPLFNVDQGGNTQTWGGAYVVGEIIFNNAGGIHTNSQTQVLRLSGGDGTSFNQGATIQLFGNTSSLPGNMYLDLGYPLASATLYVRRQADGGVLFQVDSYGSAVVANTLTVGNVAYFNNHIQFVGNPIIHRPNDNGVIVLSGGQGGGSSSGAGQEWHGNGEGGRPGQIYMYGGTNAGDVFFTAANHGYTGIITAHTDGRVDLWGPVTIINGTLYLQSPYVVATAATQSANLTLCGGISPNQSSGAMIQIFGNNAPNLAGCIEFRIGNVGTGDMHIYHGNGTQVFRFTQNGSIRCFTYSEAQHAIFDGSDSAAKYLEFQRAGVTYGYLGNAAALGASGGTYGWDDFTIRGQNRLVLASEANILIAMPVYNQQMGYAYGNVLCRPGGLLAMATGLRASDLRDVEPFTDGTAALRLNPALFTFDGQRHLGLVFDEVTAVDGRLAYEAEGGDPRIDARAVVAALVATVKYLNTRLTDLEARVH